MLKSMLVGLDGSLYSQAATELSIEWARRFGATPVGIGVIDEPTIRKPEATPIGGSYYKEHSDEVQLEHVTAKIQKLLAHFSRCCAEAGIEAKERQEIGDPAEQIILQTQRHDVVLLGQKTWYQFLTQEGPCDTLKKVLKGTARPVVVVPESLKEHRATVVLYDGSLQVDRALQYFTQLGIGAEQDVHIVAIDTSDEQAAGNVERAVEYLWHHGIDANPHILAASPNIGPDLLEKSKTLDAGLLVMGAWGKSAFREFFVGSVTQFLIAESSVPLFISD